MAIDTFDHRRDQHRLFRQPPGIDSLRSQEDESGNIHRAPFRRLKSGDPVVILDGPFSHLVGVSESMSDDEQVAILLDQLGRKIRVRLDLESVEAA